MQTTNGAIVVTGAAGFIGSYLVGYLNENGFDDIIIVDDFSRSDKEINLEGRNFLHKIDRNEFFDWIAKTKLLLILCFILVRELIQLNLIMKCTEN